MFCVHRNRVGVGTNGCATHEDTQHGVNAQVFFWEWIFYFCYQVYICFSLCLLSDFFRSCDQCVGLTETWNPSSEQEETQNHVLKLP